MTGNISCIFKFRVLLWGIEVLKTGDGRRRASQRHKKELKAAGAPA